MLTSKTAPAATSTLLNFVVVGERRSGTAVVSSALNQTPGVVCHADLLFAEYGTPQEQDATRRSAHEAYYGPGTDKLREWFNPESNAYRYLTDQVFDNPREGEARVGVRMLYPFIDRFDLYELLEERCREGDFCLVHVVRNPIACLVSARQADRSGVWRRQASDREAPRCPPPLSLDPAEVVEHVRRHEAILRKVRACCDDRLEVAYRDLVFSFDSALSGVFEFLELPQQRIPRPTLKRLRNHDMRARISNYAALRAELPTDVRVFLEADLF